MQGTSVPPCPWCQPPKAQDRVFSCVISELPSWELEGLGVRLPLQGGASDQQIKVITRPGFKLRLLRKDWGAISLLIAGAAALLCPCCLPSEDPCSFPGVVYLDFHPGRLREMKLFLRGTTWFSRGRNPRLCRESRWGPRGRTEGTSHHRQMESHRNPPPLSVPRGLMHGHQVKTTLHLLDFFFCHPRRWWPWLDGPSSGQQMERACRPCQE